MKNFHFEERIGFEVVTHISEPVKGNYNGHDYSNVYVSVCRPTADGLLVARRVKMKEQVYEAYKDKIKLAEVVQFAYDNFGNVIGAF